MEAAKTLRDKGFKVVGHHGDLSSEQGCEQLVAAAIEAFGQLDILIHNAGWVGYQPIEETDATFIGRALDINIYTPVWLCKHAWKHLKQSSAACVEPEWVAPGVVFLASQQCEDSGYVLRASNGQFTATRFVENPGVDYPVDLARVKADSAEQVAQLWNRIKEC
ncbi:Oxidoreductase, short-chain dehydrogenase/reductase family [Pseudomonas sp. R4-34-07]|nr:Oxidoreductase, short-chain dehydrogenase/reductase family [Pseudomonas sp. R4-34-07]